MVGPSSGSNLLKEYLKRYESNVEDENKKKKKKKKSKNKPDINGILIVDEDPVWQKAVQIEEEDDESQGMSIQSVLVDCIKRYHSDLLFFTNKFLKFQKSILRYSNFLDIS